MLAYRIGALLAGLCTPGWPLRVSVDGATITDGNRRMLQVGVLNGRTIGGGTPLAPHAQPDVVLTRGRTVELAGPPLPINSDGELGDGVSHRRWTVQPRAWRILAPPAIREANGTITTCGSAPPLA
ncbi:MAG: hypothetical protein ACRDTA_06540 [Pseudonocardiaceae bacterium]